MFKAHRAPAGSVNFRTYSAVIDSSLFKFPRVKLTALCLNLERDRQPGEKEWMTFMVETLFQTELLRI